MVVVREIGSSGQRCRWDAATGHAGCGPNPDVIGHETHAPLALGASSRISRKRVRVNACG